MTTTVAKRTYGEVSRPLKVLVPLIKDELAEGDHAGLSHYRRAGGMLIEAREQVPHGRWGGWLKQNFALSADTAWRYMRLANVTNTAPAQHLTMTLSAATGDPRTTHQPSWQAPIRKILNEHVDVESVAQERQTRDEENDLHRKLAVQLIDIGFKVLATKLHPDRGGSKEAMTRLNRVRSDLKDMAERRRFV